MTTRVVQVIISKGLEAELPVLEEGEWGLCTDTEKVFLGTKSGNKEFAGISELLASVTNGNGWITVDGAEIQVYDDTALKELINEKAAVDDTSTSSTENTWSAQKIYAELNKPVVIESRTTDPVNPAVGEMWLLVE